MIYDLRFICPKLDRFWNYDFLKKALEAKKTHLNADIFINNQRQKRDYSADDLY